MARYEHRRASFATCFVAVLAIWAIVLGSVRAALPFDVVAAVADASRSGDAPVVQRTHGDHAAILGEARLRVPGVDRVAGGGHSGDDGVAPRRLGLAFGALSFTRLAASIVPAPVRERRAAVPPWCTPASAARACALLMVFLR